MRQVAGIRPLTRSISETARRIASGNLKLKGDPKYYTGNGYGGRPDCLFTVARATDN